MKIQNLLASKKAVTSLNNLGITAVSPKIHSEIKDHSVKPQNTTDVC